MPARRMISFFTIVLLIWTAMNAYVFWRVSSIPALASVPHAAMVVVSVALWLSYVSGRLLARRRGWG